jgi:RHS repeat-associated protein
MSYDANGNLASDGLASYTWNARNQLTSLSGAPNGSFAYDAQGRRRVRTTSETTSYLYDGANAAQELVGGNPTANILTGGVDEVFQRTDSAGASAVLTDALGSTVALVDGSGAVQTQYTYEPFGATTSSGAASGNPAQYTGRENDGTGLYYYRARYYNPALGRFLSEDPLGFGGGDVSLFAYVGNAPTQHTDPTGQVFIPSRPGMFPACERLGGRKEPSWWDRLSCDLELGQVLLAPAAVFGPEEDALIQLAKEARQLGGVTEDAANTLLKWAEELGLRTSEGIEIHPGRNFDIPHIRIGPINHIPVK